MKNAESGYVWGQFHELCLLFGFLHLVLKIIFFPVVSTNSFVCVCVCKSHYFPSF